MPSANVPLQAFNRGRVSRLALARTDIDRIALSSEIQTNWMPRVLGSMMLRPGLEYITSTYNNAKARFIPFIFSSTDVALLEFTDSALRVLVDEQPITRVSVSTAVANGSFDSNLSSWTDSDEAGATSSWATGGYMSLVGTGFNAAIRDQTLTVSGGDQNKEHALRIVVSRGPVLLRVGSTSGNDDYISETSLGTGTHSLAFTPTGASVYVRFLSRSKSAKLIDSVAIESAGVMILATPWTESDLSLLRTDESADIVYIACYGHRQRKIERRATRSWSIVNFDPEDGPFRTINTSKIVLTPSATSGDITLTASAAFFKPTNVESLFRIESSGQLVTSSLAGDDQYTDPIRVNGVSSSRNFTLTITGTWVATLQLQRSIGDVGSWTDCPGFTYTGNISGGINDTLDNQIIYYRVGIKTGNYTSGTAVVSLEFAGGSIAGIAKVTAYTSPTQVSAQVLKDLGGVGGTENWYEGAWSDRRGYPSSVCLYDGRLWWAGKDKIFGSVSDSFESYDDTVEGDSGPISRSIGSGPVDNINWLLPLNRLLLGTSSAEKSCRSSSLDEPLSPTNFNIKTPSTQGSAKISPLVVDDHGFFVQKSGRRLFQLTVSSDVYNYDYQSIDATMLCPEIGASGFVALGAQRQPDTRIHGILGDGTVAILIFDPVEKAMCWVDFETNGVVEDVVVLPGIEEDQVYYSIKRTINGSTVRYLEKWARESECIGGTISKLADSHVVYSGVATTSITGLDHLEGETVIVWGDGADLGTKTVSGGAITLDSAVSNCVVGLYYEARFKSTKLAFAAGMGTGLAQRKRVNSLAVIMLNTHAQGLKYGPDFDNLDDLPMEEGGEIIDSNYVWDTYDKEAFEFPGTWDTDSRLCLFAAAPRSVTLCAAIIDVATKDKG